MTGHPRCIGGYLRFHVHPYRQGDFVREGSDALVIRRQWDEGSGISRGIAKGREKPLTGGWIRAMM